jgi:hypothetical protein
MPRVMLAFIILCALVLSACNETSTYTYTKAPKVEEQDLRITFGGFIQGGPQDQKLEGICGPDWTRSEFDCDIYNGLPNWNVTELTLQVNWSPYGDSDHRFYKQRVSISPFTTQKVSITLGTRLPNSVRVGRTTIEPWHWLIVGAKGTRAQAQ